MENDIFELLDNLIKAVETYAFACDHGWPQNAQNEMINAKTEIIELVSQLEADNKVLKIKLEESCGGMYKCDNDFPYIGTATGGY
jgi:hypothetical protein